MDAETWKKYCQEMMQMTEKVMLVNEKPMPQTEFKCDVCGMLFSCLTNLEGVKHLAIEIKCGGSWRKSNGSGKTEIAKASEGSGIPVLESKRDHQGA